MRNATTNDPAADPVRLHAASLARLAELGATHLLGPGAEVPSRLDPAIWAAASARADAQLQDRGITHGSLLSHGWIGPARTLAAPSGQLRLEIARRDHGHNELTAGQVDGWWSEDGVVIAIVRGDDRDVITAPHADALPFLLLGLTGTLTADPLPVAAASPAPSPLIAVSNPQDLGHFELPGSEPMRLYGADDPTEVGELRNWQRRWRLRTSNRDHTHHDLVVVTTRTDHWIVEAADDVAPRDRPSAAGTEDTNSGGTTTRHGTAPRDGGTTRDGTRTPGGRSGGWQATRLDVVGLWDRLLALVPSPPRRDADSWHTVLRPELAISLQTPLGWQAVPSAHERQVRLHAPEAGTSVTVRRAARGSLVDELVGAVTLTEQVVELDGRPVQYRLVHHLTEDGRPMCAAILRELDSASAGGDEPPSGHTRRERTQGRLPPIEVMASAYVGRWRVDRATLLRIAASVVPMPDGPRDRS